MDKRMLARVAVERSRANEFAHATPPHGQIPMYIGTHATHLSTTDRPPVEFSVFAILHLQENTINQRRATILRQDPIIAAREYA